MQMQKIIDQILQGEFDYENGSLDFSCEKIELSVRRGQQCEGSFCINGPRGLYTNGIVLSSDWRMECLTGEFTGESEEIAFCFHGETLEEGDVVKGSFEVISNRGEYYLPFAVTVEYTMPESSVGVVKNLFHFANLAKSNWKEAVKLFYLPEFGQVLSGSDAEYSEDYRALSSYNGWEQNVEEFLIRIHKKEKVEFLTEEQELSVKLPAAGLSGGVTEQELTVIRNGWGYTRLFVKCTGDFLFTEKEVLTDDDFLGNRCGLPVFVDGSLCHSGKNFGLLCLYNSYVTLHIPVTVQMGIDGAGAVREADRKRYIIQMMEFYLSFRMRKIGTSAWLKETGSLVEKLVKMDENDISVRLFQAQILITEERYNEAGWILDHVAELFEKRKPQDTLRAYYLYLTTLIHGEEEYIVRVTAEVERIFRRDETDWRVAWLLLYLSDEYNKSDRKKWALFERLFQAGCVSPVVYIEAISALNANPALLRRLGRFERQLLYWGARQGLLKREVTEQLIYLTGRVKEYSRVLFETLKILYEKKKDVRILQEICALLVKGGKTGTAYSDWYRAGVEAQLRITNLYEYYMMSLDLDRPEEIPRSVLIYFSYQNSLDYVRSAYLYEYVLQNRDELGDIYEAYRPGMEYFVTDQMKKGHIDRHLAGLYNKLLRPHMVDEQTSEPLSRLLFAHLIQVEDDRLRKVYVYQPGNLYPGEYILTDRRTWVPLYGSRYTIVFEDAGKNRFIKSAEYTMEKLIIPGKFLRWLLPFTAVAPELDLYLCGDESICREEPGERIKREVRIADSDYAQEGIRRDICLRILQFYYDTDDMFALDEYLKRVPAEELTAAERSTVIRFMVLRGSYDLAGEWLKTYGPYFVDVKILARLISALMERRNMAGDPLLTAAAVSVFRKGKYDSRILEYLILHYRGMTRNLRDIWKAARSFDVDCYRLSEFILVRMLYSGAFVGEKMEIFRHYLSQGARPEVEEAFLAQCAYDCFVRDRVMENVIFYEIGRMYRREEPVQKVCKLAYLKYFAENREEMDEDSAALAKQFLKEMIREGIRLEFFRKFEDCPEVRQELADKTILEYHTNPHCRVCIHYSLLHESGEAAGYRAEHMKEAFGGVFFKEFVLFFGESLQYYITEERNGEEMLTESGSLQRGDGSGYEEESRYRTINDIVISQSMEDFDTMDNLLEEYLKKEFLNERLFVLR